MGSSRFPGKPLAQICGITMIEHVYRRTKMSQLLSDVYVATCDQKIMETVTSFGGKAIMTKDTHERASDRVAEAMLKIEEQHNMRVDILVMIQGDEPLVHPTMIEESLKPLLEDASVKVANLLAPLHSTEEQNDPNEIKVVVDKESNALYFSRVPIPSRDRVKGDVPIYKQVCIIPFRRDYLLEFNSLEQTPLEMAESVDMMRVLEYGEKVKMVPTRYETYSVDTQDDLERVSKLMENDPLFAKYRTQKSQV